MERVNSIVAGAIVIATIAAIAGTIMILKGHATDGASIITGLFGLASTLLGGHLGLQLPGQSSGQQPAKGGDPASVGKS